MFDEFQSGDKIISDLDETETIRVVDMDIQFEEFETYRRKMIRSHNKFQALQVLFWEDMMSKHERCETASSRGKVLSTRKVDGRVVIIERQDDYE